MHQDNADVEPADNSSKRWLNQLDGMSSKTSSRHIYII